MTKLMEEFERLRQLIERGQGTGESFAHTERVNTMWEELRNAIENLECERDVMKLCEDACIEFVRKVECGEARSKRSYAQMKDALNKCVRNRTELKAEKGKSDEIS